MKQYPKYKDSGIQWIGQIPEGWNVGRLKDISVFINGYAFNSNTFSKEYGKRVIRIGDIGSTIDYVNCIRTTEQNDALGLYRIYENDILIAMSGATTGKSCLAVNVEEAYINQRVGIIRSEHYGYISYILQMPYLSEYISLNDAGSAQPNISGKSIGNLPISIPPVSEQESIARYLDDKTAKIDETVNLLVQQKADLQQYRKALISQTVTRGLTPNAKLKDSGIQWIGQIPDTWKIDRLKNYYSFEKGKRAALYTSEYIGEHYGTFPVYSGQTENDGIMGTIDSFDYDVEECLFTTTVGAKVMTPKILHGKFSLSQNCLIMQAFANNVVNHYVYYMILKLFEHAKSQIPTYMQPSLRIEDLKKYICVIPPLSEQQAIADYLDNKTAKIDEAIKRIDEQIADLRAYRTALISDVVTGKIDVRN